MLCDYRADDDDDEEEDDGDEDYDASEGFDGVSPSKRIRVTKVGGGSKGKKTRGASASRASETSVRWVTCVACGKICKNNYLFKIHLKNFGPYHNNSCALCHAVFDTWEQHIAHLVIDLLILFDFKIY